MTLSEKEKALVIVSNAISVYSIYAKNPETLPKGMSMVDFVLKCTPMDLRKEISIELIDEVFDFVSRTQAQLS
jgi:glyceraldehyde-3-phosphate dehydrogenase/erythrose-4-phosphate dehydrogenase